MLSIKPEFPKVIYVSVAAELHVAAVDQFEFCASLIC